LIKIKRLIGLIILLVLLVGCSNSTDIDGEKVTFEELQDKISEKEDDLEEVENKIKSSEKDLNRIEKDLSDNKKKYDDLETLAKNEEDLKSEVKTKEDELEELEETLKETQEKFDTLQGDLVKMEDEPLKVNAGYFYFGSDIEPGRYIVKPQSGNSGNFFVRGTNRVNIILGNDSERHLEEYTFEASDGDELETGLPIELYPAEQ